MRNRSPETRNKVWAGAKASRGSIRAVSQGRPQPTLDVSPRLITPKEFLLFQALIYRESGIWLSEVKTELLTARLSKRLRALRLNTFYEYYSRVREDVEECLVMLDAITTNETHFFREPGHFQLLEEQILPAWRDKADAGERTHTIRAWSAGCSTGQEAYSLAMLLVDHLQPSKGWSVEIVATDLSRRALAVAEEGVWNADKAAEIPPAYLRAYMLEGIGENRGKIKAAPAIRIVRFLRLNLNDAIYPQIGRFDLIFCRNVLIYFDVESRRRVINKLLDHLIPEGYLFVGHAETLNTMCPGLRCVIPTVYASAGERNAKRESAR
jgi:chemotaxis protein methyltransferase CheR